MIKKGFLKKPECKTKMAEKMKHLLRNPGFSDMEEVFWGSWTKIKRKSHRNSGKAVF